MKKRTKEEMAAYQKARRHAMTPKKCNTPDVTPVSVPCPNCAALSLEVKTLLAKVAQLEAQVKRAATKPEPLPKGDDADALRKRVIADKINRINNYGKGANIGTVSL